MISRAKRILAFFVDRDGATAVEYATVVLLVFLALLSAIILVGQHTAGRYQDPHGSVQDAVDSRP